MEKILFSTTEKIEGYKIIKYVDIVSTNVVIGTWVGSDFLAGFTDFFGGKSGTYTAKLESLYNKALDDLGEIALKKRANAIIGLKFDFGEITGHNKQMFMLSVVGNAVKIKSNLDFSLDLLKEFETTDSLFRKAEIQLELSYNGYSEEKLKILNNYLREKRVHENYERQKQEEEKLKKLKEEKEEEEKIKKLKEEEEKIKKMEMNHMYCELFNGNVLFINEKNELVFKNSKGITEILSKEDVILKPSSIFSPVQIIIKKETYYPKLGQNEFKIFKNKVDAL